MDDLNYVLSSAFMLAMLAILFVRAFSLIKTKKSRVRCLVLIGATAFYVLMDLAFVATSLWAECPTNLFRVTVFVFYLIYVTLPFAWHLYVRNFVGRTYPKWVEYLELIPVVFLIVLVLINPFTGILWSIDDTGGAAGYHRGSWFGFYTYFNYFYYVEPIIDMIVVFIRKNQKKEPYFLQSVFISLVPLFGAVINALIPQGTIFPFMPFCSVVVAMLAFFFMGSQEAQRLEKERQDEIQNALAKAQEATAAAEEASRVKTVFLSNMSHDIRTPMNAIINLTHLAQGEKDEEKIHGYLDKLAVSGQFLLGLINDILDMSRIESGEVILKKERFPREEFNETIETVIKPLMDAKSINFHMGKQGRHCDILVDKTRFNQIFLNLLSNAEKFTPEGGDVWFDIATEILPEDRIKIVGTVRDTGIGMSEEFLNHLFEPFAQEHSAYADKRQGTGLGLSIAKRLAEAMGGDITVKSKLGEGSEFTVTLYAPMLPKEELGAKPIEHEENVSLKGMHVLLVEDNELNVYVARTILEKEGCIVSSANNGQVALDAFKASSPGDYQAILMDVRMPVMDGLQATKAIRALPRPDAKSIPIIAMTADAFDDERKRTLESGMNYHLSKPVDAKELCKVLGECAGKQNS